MTDIQQVQAASQGVDLADDSIEFLGARFRMSSRVGLMPLMKFAMTAKKGVGSDDLEGLAAMYSLIRDCIDQTKPQKPVLDEAGQPTYGEDGQPVTEDDGPSEWDRFEAHAIEAKADAEDLFKVVTEVIQRLSARPTKRPGDSSAGPQTTSPSSKGISSTPPAQAPPAAAVEPPAPAETPRPLRAVPGIDEMVDVTALIAAR